MERIINNKHPRSAIFNVVSNFFQKIAHYGVRTLIVLYMINGVLEFDRETSLEIYGQVILYIMLGKVLGGILGDLVLGTKRTLVLGGILQSAGAFTLSIPTPTGLYLGLLLFILGTGLYSPNLFASQGKIYIKTKKLLDAGMSFTMLGSSLGAFLAIVALGYIGDVYGFHIGFIITGSAMIISTLFILFSKTEEVQEEGSPPNRSKRAGYLLLLFFIMGLFWSIYDITGFAFVQIENVLKSTQALGIHREIWSSMFSISIVVMMTLMTILWTIYYYSSQIKFFTGCVAGVLGFGLLLLIPGDPRESHAVLYLIFLLLMGFAEVNLTPIFYSLIVKHSRSKYYALLISLTSVPIKILTGFFTVVFIDFLNINASMAKIIGIAGMSLVAILALIYWLGTQQQEEAQVRKEGDLLDM